MSFDLQQSALLVKSRQHIFTTLHFHKGCLGGVLCIGWNWSVLQRLCPEAHQQSHLSRAADHAMSLARDAMKVHGAACMTGRCASVIKPCLAFQDSVCTYDRDATLCNAQLVAVVIAVTDKLQKHVGE